MIYYIRISVIVILKNLRKEGSIMEFIAQKFRRGQVWMIHEPKEVTDAKKNTHYRFKLKTRPYLLVTDSDIMNRTFTAQAFPITSNCEYLNDDYIIFRNLMGERNQICMNELKTIDLSEKSLITYMYDMPDACMEEIEKIILRRLGISGLKNMENIIEEPEIEKSSSNQIEKFNRRLEASENKRRQKEELHTVNTKSVLPEPIRKRKPYVKIEKDTWISIFKELDSGKTTIPDIMETYGCSRSSLNRHYKEYRSEVNVTEE